MVRHVECFRFSRAHFGIVLAFSFFIVFVRQPSAMAAGNGSWVGTSGNWNDPTHWSSNPNVPNDYPSTTYTSFANMHTLQTPYTATVTTPVTLQALQINGSGTTIAVDSAHGASLGALLTTFFTGTLIYDGDATLAKLNSTQNTELLAYEGTISAGGNNLSSDIYISGRTGGANTFHISNVNVLTNNGLLQPEQDTFAIAANSIVNHGTIQIADNATLNAGSGVVNLADGVLDGTAGVGGTLDGAIDFTSNTITKIGVSQGAPVVYDLKINSPAATALGGTLTLEYPDVGGQTISPSGAYTILQDPLGFVGEFSNAPNGSRIATQNGLGNFQINYEATSVVLSNWIATPPLNIPEPATTSILLAGGAFALLARRRAC